MLRSGDQDEIVKMFNQLRAQARMIVKQLVQLTFYMRGGIQYSDLLLNRTRAERDIIEEVVRENLESQKGAMSLVY